MKVDLVVAGVVASVVLAVVLVGAVASDVQGSKKKRKALHEVPFFDYSSFRSSTLSPSVGAILLFKVCDACIDEDVIPLQELLDITVVNALLVPFW